MFPYTCSEFLLQLNAPQLAELRQAFNAIKERVENKKIVEPMLVARLNAALQTALTPQKPWQQAVKDTQSSRNRMVQLLHSDNDVLSYPWHLAAVGHPFLHLSKGFGTEGGDVSIFQPAKVLPLKILVVISMPDDLTETQRLDHEGEIESLITAFEVLLSDAQVEIDFANDGTLATLQDKLATNAYHILHFSGHGVYDEQKKEGELVMENDNFKQCRVSGKAFAEVLNLVPEHRPELVLLSACESAKGFDSITKRLQEAGVPSVVSMNLRIHDRSATFFAAALYRNIVGHLKTREPLSRSFALAIKAMKTEETERRLSVGQHLIPQLFTTQHVQDLVADYKSPERHSLKYNAVKFVTGEKQMLLEKQQGYTFVGRRAEIRKAMPILQANGAVLLRGQGGVGKTALAEYLTGRLLLNDAKLYPFMLDEKKTNIEDLSKAMIAFLDKDLRKFSIRSKAQEIEKATDKFWYLMELIDEAKRFPIFIFDNLESFQDGVGGYFQEKHHDLRDLISDIIERGFPVIFTSRYPVLDFPTVKEVNLNQIAFGDFFRKAQNLRFYDLRYQLDTEGSIFERRLSHSGSNNLDFKQVVHVLHKTLGGNHRALEFFDAIYQTDSRKAYETFEQLDEFNSQLKADSAKVREQLQNNAKSLVFEQLLALLTPTELRVLQLLEPFRVPVLLEAIEMQDPSVSNLNAKLQKLFNLTLIEQHDLDDGHQVGYYVAPLVRDWLQEFKLVLIGFNHMEAGDYFDKLLNTTYNITYVEEAYFHYYTASNKQQINKYGSNLCNYYFLNQVFNKAYNIGKQTEDFVGEQNTEDILINCLGQILLLYGRLDEALLYFERNLIRSNQTDNLKNKGAYLNNVGLIYYAKGDYTTALQYFEQSIEHEIENIDKSTTLNNIGLIYHSKGDFDTALSYLEQSLIITRQVGNLQGEGKTLSNISQSYFIKGDYDIALRFLEQSLNIQQQINDQDGASATLNNMSQIYKAKGDYDSTLLYLKQSLTITREVGNRQGESTNLNNIAEVKRIQNDYDSALSYLEQSLNIAQQIGDRKGEAVTLNNISQIYKFIGKYDVALHYLEQSLNIQQTIGDRKGEATTLNNLATTTYAKSDFLAALDYFEQSLNIKRQIGDTIGLATTFNNIGAIYWEQHKDAVQAIPCFIQAYKIFDKIGSPNIQNPNAYLNLIIAKIGKARFKEIMIEFDAAQE